MHTSLPSHVDALVIGGGPAGLSAATWLGRYQRHTLVVDAGNHRNRAAEHVHGLLGHDPITPGDFLSRARAGVAQYDHVLLHEGTVQALEPTKSDGRFRAIVDGTQVTAERVVLATGVRDRLPDVEGFSEHYGTDVHHCPSCDGPAARGRTVIALGSGEHVPGFAADLLDWADTVRIVTDTTSPAFDPAQRATLDEHGIEVIDGTAQALIGEPGALEGLRLTDGRVVEAAMVLFSYAHHPTNSLAQALGCELDEHGQILVNGFQLTSVDGVYACGDITPGIQLVGTAIGQGTVAGVACATSLHGHRTTDRSPTPAPPARWFTPA